MEVFHHTLRNDFRIGQLRRDEARREQEASMVFCSRKCQVAYALHRKRPPARPKIRVIVHLVAMLDSLLGRKGDGQPGLKSLWQGLQKLHHAVATVEMLSATGTLA